MQDKDGTALAVGDPVTFLLAGRWIKGTAEGRAGKYIICRRTTDGCCFGIEPGNIQKMAPVEKTGRQK